MTTRWESLRDGAQVGGLFGLAGGVGALLLVAIWAIVARLGSDPPPLRATLVAHLVNVVCYVVAGAIIGAGWPIRTELLGRLTLWAAGFAAAMITVFTLARGPFWRWSLTTWGQFVVAAVLFAVALGWAGSSKPTVAR